MVASSEYRPGRRGDVGALWYAPRVVPPFFDCAQVIHSAPLAYCGSIATKGGTRTYAPARVSAARKGGPQAPLPRKGVDVSSIAPNTHQDRRASLGSSPT